MAKFYFFAVVILLFGISSAKKQGLPPIGIPPTFFSNVIYSYSNLTLIPPKVVYSKLQNIASDHENQWICRYRQQVITPPQNATPDEEYCDYSPDEHTRWHSIPGSGQCFSYDSEPEFPLLQFPKEFIQFAQYLGDEVVGDYLCAHWFAQFWSFNKQIGVDVFVHNDTIPCKVSVTHQKLKVLTWAFSGFQTEIPDTVRQICNVTIACASSLTCVANRTAPTQVLVTAINGACGYIDCSPLQPGGNLANATFFEKVDWALGQYYAQFAPKQGIDACYWGGAGIIVAVPLPPPSEIPVVSMRRAIEQPNNEFVLFPPNLACNDFTPIPS